MESADVVRQLRSDALDIIKAAVEGAQTEGAPRLVVIDVISPADAAPFLATVAGEFAAHSVTATDPSLGGEVLTHLSLPQPVPPGAMIVVDRAHLADATSLSHLHRLLVETDGPLVIVLAKDPTDELGSMAIERLATTTGRTLTRFSLDPLDAGALRELISGPSTERFIDALIDHGVDDRRIVARLSGALGQGLLTSDGSTLFVAGDEAIETMSSEIKEAEIAVGQVLITAGTPVHASAIASVLAWDPDAVLTAGDGLVRAGLATDGPKGYGPTDALSASVELTSARRAHLAGTLVDHLPTSDPATIGKLLDQADRPAEAFDRLRDAATDRSASGQGAEAFWLAGEALALVDRIAPPPARSDVGALYVIRARHLRNAGWSQKALEEAQLAIPQLDGVARIGAMSLAAALSDDLQLPQQAERHLAMAELAAHESGNQTEVGPLLSLHARTLSRLGFPTEADAALTKGEALLTGEDQRYSADTHRAWIELDRGEARLAERSFASLADRATDRGPAVLATQLVYWGRALFMTGDAHQALEAIDRAEQLARSSGATAVLFLAALARAEGTAAFERWDDYLAVSERLLDLVLHHLPQWENIARYHRGRALSETGATSTAQLEIHRAIDACPPGADGWRWRRRCEAARMVIDQAAGQGWKKEEAENLTDELLVSRWFGTAVELMTARAVIENDQELASHAATLADEIGNPLLTAKAVDTADAWSEPASARVADKARALATRLPEGWRDDWQQLPYVAAALARTEEPSEDTPEFREALATAWAGLGLSEGDSPLSPAQRQSSGLVRRAPARLGRRLATVLFGAAAVVALSVGVTFALGGFSDPETVVVEVTVPRATTTIPFVLETNEVPLPAGGLAGTFPFRGNSDHTGVVAVTGVPDVGGIYWVYSAGDSIGTSPVTYGQWVYFGSNDHNVYAIEQETGRLAWRMETGGPVQSTPAIGQIDTGDGPMNLLVAGSNDGKVWARDAADPNEGALWTYDEIGVAVRTSPLILRVVPQTGEREDYVIVAGGDGYVHAISASGGQGVWRYPAEEAAAPFTGSPTERDGIIYAGDATGRLHLIDALTGTAKCVFAASGAITSAPAISDGVVYIGDQGRNLWQIPEGICPSLASAQPELLGVVLDKEIAVADGFAYYADGSRVTKLELPGGDVVATWSTPDLNEPSAPIIAGDVIYVGSEDFYVYALSLEMEELWRFNTGGLVTTSVAVGDGVVFVTSGSGRLYAIAPRP